MLLAWAAWQPRAPARSHITLVLSCNELNCTSCHIPQQHGVTLHSVHSLSVVGPAAGPGKALLMAISSSTPLRHLRLQDQQACSWNALHSLLHAMFGIRCRCSIAGAPRRSASPPALPPDSVHTSPGTECLRAVARHLRHTCGRRWPAYRHMKAPASVLI